MLTLAKLRGTLNVCAQALAETDVQLLTMPIEHFRRPIRSSDCFSSNLMRAMANCLSEVMEFIAEISFQRLGLACLIGQLSGQRAPRRLSFTHQEVANELGTTRGVISRLLKEFEHMGCIKLSRGNIEGLSGEALARIAGAREMATRLS